MTETTDPRGRPGPGDKPLATAAILYVAFLLPLWLMRGTYLVNWDSVQFALGVDAFDVAAHQPHPPGYIGYELLGRGLTWLVGDVPSALTLLSVLSGAAAPVGLYVVARRMLERPYALAAAVLFGCSPLLWHYGGVALTYAPAVALSLPFVYLAHRAEEEGRVTDLLGAALAFAVLGSVRQSELIMLAPLWPWALRPFPLRRAVQATAVLVGLCLVWAVPLWAASGGLGAYVRESMDLAGLAVARTAFVTASFSGVLQNLGILAVGLFVGMHVTPWVIRSARRAPGGSLGALRPRDRRFLFAWVVVPVLFFVFIHTGQPGYALILLPAGYVWVASALAQSARRPAPEEPVDARPSRRPAKRPWAQVAVLCGIGVATFFALPSFAFRIMASEPAAALQQRVKMPSPADRSGDHAGDVPTRSPLADAMRQYDVRRNDAYWGPLLEFIRGYPTGESAVLTAIGGPLVSGSFRELGYYLPGHRVYGVGWDGSGDFGYLFLTRFRKSNYSVANMRSAARTLPLPRRVRLLIVPDADVAGLLDPASFRTERRLLQGGASVTLAIVPDGSVLEFTSEGNRASIRLRQPTESP